MRIENSFIPARGVGETTERTLWEQGVTHWDEFDPSHLGAKTGERVESFIAEATERLDDDDARYFGDVFPRSEAWRLYKNFRDEAVFFDIETTGLSRSADVVTTVSFHRDGETTSLIRDRDLTRERVRERLDAPLLVTFNGARFDVPFLEESFDIDVDAPHVDLLYPCRRLDLTGGLKAIEREVDIERDRPDISGRDAVRLWHEYRSGRESSLETLVSYNREDAVHLRTLMELVANRLHEDVFASVCG